MLFLTNGIVHVVEEMWDFLGQLAIYVASQAHIRAAINDRKRGE